MAIYVDVVTGFLESGKTTFIKEVIKSKQIESFNKVVLIVCEEGFTEYDEEELEKYHICQINLEQESKLTDDLFNHIFQKYNPDYIIVEYNGTWDLSKLLRLKMPMGYKFRNVVFVSEANTFKNQLSNMASLLQPHILNSDVVVFNRHEKMRVNIHKKLRDDVKNINPKTKVIFFKEFETDRKLNGYFLPFEKQNRGNSKLYSDIIILFILSFSIILIFVSKNVYGYVQSIVTVFLSILIQAVPFILLGAFISAIIQIFVSTGWIMKQMTKGNLFSFFVAAVAGFFVPICDCGMVPIISGLLKKETPLPQTITFWLASSAVSPVVIVSMLYAFPEQPYLAIIRIATGVLIGIIAGIILKLIKLETKDVIKGKRGYRNVGKDLLDLKYEGIIGKLEAVFGGAKIEFFRVAEYVIVGALLSAVFQTVMPQTMKNFIGKNLILQFLVMIVAALFMSTCSTSNAFIGRSFSSNFSTIPILSFIVMGPMLDLKNMVMLSEILKKRFLVFLACLVIVESAIIFSTLAIYL